MKHRIKYLCLLSLFAGLQTLPIHSIPAKPGLMEIENGNGEKIKVRLTGDERFHCYFTEDGYPLMETKAGLTYCSFTSGGDIKDSGITAVAPEKRDAKARAWLSGVDRSVIGERLNKYQSSITGNAKNVSLPSASLPARVAPYPMGPGIVPATTFPAYGEQKALVILVEFKDVKYRIDNPHEYFYDMLNAPGFSEDGATGSARDYFIESSKGSFSPEFDVYGPVELPHNLEFYGGNDMNGNDVRPAEMVAEACILLDGEIDYTQYDRDGNGVVDNVYVYYAGLSEASGGGADCVWPHAWHVSEGTESPVLDGVKIDRYACSNEWAHEAPCGIGTFVHEFSHVLGLPDLYSTSYTGAFTPGEWSAMDVGPYNNDGRTPPLYSAFERYVLGWINPIEIKDTRNVVLPAISKNVAAIIKTDVPNEYFLMENRQQEGWDKYIPGHGMLIWHIDYQPEVWTGNRVNNLPYHQYIDIEEADGMASYENIGGDAFPGDSGVSSFTDQTVPSMKTWKGLSLGLPITEIEEDSNGVIRFKVKGGGPALPEADELIAEDIRAHSFLARWKKAEGDYGYLLSVGIPGDKGDVAWLPEYRYLNVGNADSFQVEGLKESTDYIFSIITTDGLDYAQEVASDKFATTERTLEYENAIAEEAIEISSDSFTARWQPISGASSYMLTVYTKKEGEPEKTICSFDGGADNLPEGWESNSRQSYNMASYCGESVPSLRFAYNGDMLTTTEYDDQLYYLSFWHRGNSTSEDDVLEISCYDGSEWIGLETVKVVSEKGGALTMIDKIPDGVKAIRIRYDRKGEKGSVALDDVTLGHGATLIPDLLEGFEGRNVGNVCQFKVEGLLPDTDYYYTVFASDGQYNSGTSEEIRVCTLSDSNVRVVEKDKVIRIVEGTALTSGNEEIFIYDAVGVLLKRGNGRVQIPAGGIRIIAVPSAGIIRKVRF